MKILQMAGVRITIRQLAKCEKNSGLASKFTNRLASWQGVFPLLIDPFYIVGQ
jgi:hypothetical protein